MADKNENTEKERNCGFQFTQVDDEIWKKLKEYMGDDLTVENAWDIMALCGTYMLLIFPRVAMSAISSDMKDGLGFTNEDISELLMVQQIAYATGKLFNGVIIDRMDARYALWAFMTLSMGATFGWSFANTKLQMYPFLIVNFYCQSGTWPSMAKMIYNWFDANAYGRSFSFLSMSSKFGSFITLIALGGVVSVSDWRWTLRVASFVIGGGLLYSLVMMRNRPAVPKRPDHRKMTSKDPGNGVFALIKVIYKSARFWLCLASLATMTVLAGMEGFIPLLVTDVFRPCLDTTDVDDICESTFNSGEAAYVGALVPLGLIVSLIVGQVYLSDAHPTTEAKASVRFLMGATVMMIIFSIWVTMAESGSRPKEDPWNWVGFLMVFIFIYGFCIGYPYYIPPAVYSVKVGGQNSATLNALLDLGGFSLAAIYVLVGTRLSQMDGVSITAASTWRYNMYVVTITAVLSTMAMYGFQNYNLRAMMSRNLQQSVDSFLSTVELIEKPKSSKKKTGKSIAI